MSDSNHPMRSTVIGMLCVLLMTIMPALAAEPSDAAKIVNKVKFDAVDIPKQAKALVRLAWIDDQGNSQAASLARDELVKFGKKGLDALYDALTEVELRYTADIVSILTEARKNMTIGSPTEYIGALEHAIWVGSVDAKRLAIKEITRYKYRTVLLPIMDAAVEHPTLTSLAIDSLRKLGDHRARFFLDRQLREGSPAIRAQAAACLAAIGGDAIQTLRGASYSEDPAIRYAAIEALVPRTTFNDLTILHEYVYMHPEDDPEILALVRDRAMLLESLMEEDMDTESDAFSVPPE